MTITTIRKAAVRIGMALALLAAHPGAAEATTVRCHPSHPRSYEWPSVQHLRASGLPRRTSGYMPRCDVADAIAELVVVSLNERARFPRRVHAMGARWDGGVWRVRVTERTIRSEGLPYMHVAASKRRQSVTFDLYT